MIEISPNLSLQKIDYQLASTLSEVATQAYCDHYLHLWEDDGRAYIQKSFHPDNLALELNDPNNVFWLIYLDNQLVGFLKIKLTTQFENEKNALELERIYLIKAAAGRGIGQAVFRFVEELAQSRHQKVVWLKVMDSSEAAIRFYQKMGYEICGTYHLDLPFMKDELRGMYLMRKLLKNP